MVENGLYILKSDFFVIMDELKCDFDRNNGLKRPVYCCIKDNKIEGLYWAIPTSDLTHRTEEQIEKYDRYINMPSDDLRSCYYHIGYTTRKAVYKISSCFPVTDKYVLHAFCSCGQPVILKNSGIVAELERKLKRILSFENSKNNYFPQRITDIKNYLINELSSDTSQ